jgi:hypothetical protein
MAVHGSTMQATALVNEVYLRLVEARLNATGFSLKLWLAPVEKQPGYLIGPIDG